MARRIDQNVEGTKYSSLSTIGTSCFSLVNAEIYSGEKEALGSVSAAWLLKHYRDEHKRRTPAPP